ncbi:MAG: RraA family protein [Actinobacteria bacterium]|nr:RraA family protein [Actinomycetota bacterium]
MSRFSALTTPHLADACVRLGIPVRCAPAELQSLVAGQRVFGRAVPARHVGSVDVFLEAIELAAPGDVLVADNGGRRDESCIGDLMAQEAASAGLGGIVIWGLHRDSVDIEAIGIPLFSTGSIPTGPLSVSERPEGALASAHVGEWTLTRDDWVAGDEDGVLFLPADRVDEILTTAEGIRDTERRQADLIREGSRSLREQVDFAGFLAARAGHPGLTFREHLRSVGGEIEV